MADIQELGPPGTNGSPCRNRRRARCHMYLAGWIEPAIHHRYLVSTGSEAAARTQFGPQTPAGLLRNLRFLEENPPQEYSLSVDAPDQLPPNVLWWVLHRPGALAVFGLVNVLLGVLTAQLTADLRRRSRRNARVAIGVLGAIAFFASMGFASPIEPFLRGRHPQVGSPERVGTAGLAIDGRPCCCVT